jgi:Domain of unknown function (DUF5655)/Domain of unknown function (DUF4287)
MKASSASASHPASPYALHPSVAYVQAIVDNLEKHTGRTLAAWVRLLKAKGPTEAKRRRDWLKAQGLGHGQASLVAERAEGRRPNAFADTKEGYLASAPAYVERQYSGKKATLRPLYELALAAGLASGPEAKACPCQTVVPLFRTHVFAQLKASSQNRIDVGLALGDPRKLKAAGPRLLDTGGFARKDRLTHRIELTTPSDVDGTLRRWLDVAYRRDG